MSPAFSGKSKTPALGRAPTPVTRNEVQQRRVTEAAAASTKARALTSKQIFEDARWEIRGLEEALEFLGRNNLATANAQPSISGLVYGLLCFALDSPAADRAANGLLSFAHYAQALSPELHIEALTDRLAAAVSDKLDTTLASIARNTDILGGTAEDLKGGIEQLKDARDELVSNANILKEKASMAGSGVPETGAYLDSLPHLTYADAVRSPVARTPPPAHVKVVERATLQAKQLLVDNVPTADKDGRKLQETVLVEKANMAIEMAREHGEEEPPEGAKVVAASLLRNGGLLLEFSRAEHATWFRTPARARRLARGLGPEAEVKLRGYKTVVEFVPIGFEPDSEAAMKALASNNDLPEGSILGAKWIKPREQRRPEQRVAHLLLNMRTPEEANTVIRKGLTIAGKRVRAQKNIQEPVRCAKCLQYEPFHLARDCKQIRDTCGTCSSPRHRTTDCTNSDPTKLRCAACKTSGHASWDRLCPSYRAQVRKVLQRAPEHAYRLFPTQDPATWEVSEEGREEEDGGRLRWETVVERAQPWDSGAERISSHSQLSNRPPRALRQTTLQFNPSQDRQSQADPLEFF